MEPNKVLRLPQVFLMAAKEVVRIKIAKAGVEEG